MLSNKFKALFLFISLLFFFLMSGLQAGETGKIAGRVLNKSTKEPLPGANVIIFAQWIDGKELKLTTPMGAASDLNGDYFIINVPPGIYSLKTSFMGFKAEIKTQVQVFVDKTTRVDFYLSEQVLSGEEVVVTAYRPENVEADLTATKLSYSVKEILNLPGITDVSDVINLQADVDGGHFRGGRSGEELYLVGGNAIVNPLTNQTTFYPLTLALEQVEVYTSGFSAEYGNVQSGVINMVTREGRNDKWETYIDVSSTNSYYKTWGGSVYSPNYILYFNMLNNAEEWATGKDPVSGVDLWTHFGIQFPEKYMKDSYVIPGWPPIFVYPSKEDTLRSADLVRKLWLQSVRDIGLEYAKPDYRVELSAGGPIAKNTTLFIAARQNVANPILPMDRPNSNQQIMSNVTFKPTPNNKFKFTYNFNDDYRNGISDNYYRWFDRTISITKNISTTHQFGAAWNHVFSPSTFFDLKVSYLDTKERTLINLLSDTTYATVYNEHANWRHYTAPTGYMVGRMQTTSGIEQTGTFTFNATINSQVDKRNLIKAGIQLFYYDINVNMRRNASTTSQLRMETYHKFPYEGALYVQDKMEFEGLIANIGMRYDFYNMNTEYYTNKFSPYRVGKVYDKENADKKKTTLKSIVQPRIGISFPISSKSVLHLNYGVFTQRPPFEYIFADRLKIDTPAGLPDYEQLGNPQLEPERTISYDVGVVRSLPLGFYLDVSAYLKDVSNLLQYALYKDLGDNYYFTFDNREYADIRGFNVNLERNRGLFRGYVRYNWESATGKSASAIGSGHRAEYYEDDAIQDILPSPKDIYLDYNRKHKLVLNLRLVTTDNFGIKVGQIYPFENFSVSSTYRFLSGRPFTYDPSGLGLQMNKRTPNEYDLSLRLEKILFIKGLKLRVYAEGFNLLNDKVYDYRRVFEDVENTRNFKYKFIEDREHLFIQDEFAPYVTRLDGYLLSNSPRHYRFGVIFDF